VSRKGGDAVYDVNLKEGWNFSKRRCLQLDFFTQLVEMANTDAVEAEEEFHRYQSRKYKTGIYETVVKLNVNLPGPTWEEEMHRVQKRCGLYMITEDGELDYASRYPKTVGEYMAFLTALYSQLGPFEQLCVLVRFWDPKYRGEAQTKWVKWGKEELEVTFTPFNPLRFLYFQPHNKGFRELLDKWNYGVEKGGIEELLRRVAEEVFGK
jgi:hypothetical protein